MKWTALALIVFGLVSIRRAFRLDPRARFDDGSFLVSAFFFVGGAASVFAGVVALLVLWFLSI